MEPLQNLPLTKTAALLTALWERNLPVLRERLALLDAAAALAADGRLSPALRAEAAATAHKLAGSLGMFGYKEGTGLARILDQLLDSCEDLKPGQLLELTRDLRAALSL